MSWGLLLIPWVLKHLQDGSSAISRVLYFTFVSEFLIFHNLAHLFVKLNNGSKQKVNHTIEFLKTFSFPSFSFCLLETHGYVANSTVGHLPFFIFLSRFRTHVPFYFLVIILFEVSDTCPFLFPRMLFFLFS